MRVLFVKEALRWPRSSGHDVHGFHIMRSLAENGVNVTLLTGAACLPEAVNGLRLQSRLTFEDLEDNEVVPRFTRLQQKYCSYWGIDQGRIARVAKLVEDGGYDAVVVVGLNVLPYLASVSGDTQRIWYAADEGLLHHISQLKLTKPATWYRVKAAAINGFYEYAFTNCTDRVWVVSEKDAAMARWIMPRSRVDVIANGVDAEHYDPNVLNRNDIESDSKELVFWGRLDFGPNLDAIEWFCKTIWTQLRRLQIGIRWTVYGFQAGEKVRRLAEAYDFDLIPDLPDIRHEIIRHKVVVLPFISGAGIKNKFLEAAALARPIVASRRALNGVDLKDGQPCLVASGTNEWVTHIRRLLQDPVESSRLGNQAREWVEKNYSWERAATLAMESLKSNK